MNTKQAIVFFADAQFLIGFRILYKSIVKHNPNLLLGIDKIVIVDSSVNTAEFEKDFIIKKIDESQYREIKPDERFPYWHKTFYKLEIFDFPTYDRIVFLESDILYTGDISFLFRMTSAAEILGVLHVNSRPLKTPASHIILAIFDKKGQ